MRLFQAPTGKFEPVVVESAILYREFQTPTEQILHANHTAAIDKAPTFHKLQRILQKDDDDASTSSESPFCDDLIKISFARKWRLKRACVKFYASFGVKFDPKFARKFHADWCFDRSADRSR